MMTTRRCMIPQMRWGNMGESERGTGVEEWNGDLCPVLVQKNGKLCGMVVLQKYQEKHTEVHGVRT